MGRRGCEDQAPLWAPAHEGRSSQGTRLLFLVVRKKQRFDLGPVGGQYRHAYDGTLYLGDGSIIGRNVTLHTVTAGKYQVSETLHSKRKRSLLVISHHIGAAKNLHTESSW